MKSRWIAVSLLVNVALLVAFTLRPALAAEAQTKVTDALGSHGYEAYKQYGGNWMQQLQPRPVTPAVRRATP
jgi:hypothetical protein